MSVPSKDRLPVVTSRFNRLMILQFATPEAAALFEQELADAKLAQEDPLKFSALYAARNGIPQGAPSAAEDG